MNEQTPYIQRITKIIVAVSTINNDNHNNNGNHNLNPEHITQKWE